MATLVEDLRAFTSVFDSIVQTIGAIVMAVSIALAMVKPFYEVARYERRWWDDS